MNVKRRFTYFHKTRPCLSLSAILTTSPTRTTTSSALTMKELHFTKNDGFAQASSVHSSADGATYSASNGIKNTGMPRMPRKLESGHVTDDLVPVQAKISFSRHQDGTNTAEDSTIIDFRFVGVKAFKGKNCTDVYNWKSICYRRGVSVNQAHECHVPTKGESLDVGGPFQCLGLRIIDVSGARKAVALNGIKIWIWN